MPAVVVISAGFAEVGPEGAERQRRLLDLCREAGMRLVGPNCLGVVNTAPDARLNATFAPRMPAPGNVGFSPRVVRSAWRSSSSPAIATWASLRSHRSETAPISRPTTCSSTGRRTRDTDVALLYIESFSDPRRFSRVAPRVGRTKPVVVVKSGRSKAGARATSSHTGAMLAASDVTVDALFQQAGVIRTDSLAEMLDVASLLANQPLPEGRRVAVLTNAGGPGIMCADACEAWGSSFRPFRTRSRTAA